MTELTIRTATHADQAALARLAALDSAAPLRGDVLLAETRGHPVAALSSTDGRAVADPFLHSAGAVALLRAHAEQLRVRDGSRRAVRWAHGRTRLFPADAAATGGNP